MSGGPRKTYEHLAGARRMPTTYEVATTRLLYAAGRKPEVETPLTAWYERHQAGSRFTCEDWETFRDPRETTYFSYTALQRTKEAHVDGILRSIEERAYDRSLSPDACTLLEQTVPPLRFLCHGLQMASAYLGQIAPAGRIIVAAAFQTGDELRRVQRLAYRMAQVRVVHPAFGDRARAAWERDPAWQPLRALIERLLVTWDFGECFAALNLGVKPVVDTFFLDELPALARERGDHQLGEIFFSLSEDTAWHRAWTEALVRHAVGARPGNIEPLREWAAPWHAAASDAVRAWGASHGVAGSAAADRAIARSSSWLAQLGVAP